MVTASTKANHGIAGELQQLQMTLTKIATTNCSKGNRNSNHVHAMQYSWQQ